MLTFGISAITISVLSSFVFVWTLMLSLKILNKVWNMNSEKWNSLLGYKNGNGAYYLLTGTYLFSMIIMFGTSIVWFNIINLENGFLSAIIIIGITSTLGISKFSKMKAMINTKFKVRIFKRKLKKCRWSIPRCSINFINKYFLKLL